MVAQPFAHADVYGLDDVAVTGADGDLERLALKEGSVLRVKKTGGDVETIAAGEYRPSHIALDDEHVYWVNDGSEFGKRGGSVRKKKKKKN